MKPPILPEGPRSAIDSHSSCSCCEPRTDLATHRTLVQVPSRIQGAMHPATTLSFQLAALVVSVGRTRPANSFTFRRKMNTWKGMYVLYTSSQRNLWVACMCRACETCRTSRPYGRPHRSSRRRRRQGGRRCRGTGGRRARPRRNHH